MGIMLRAYVIIIEENPIKSYLSNAEFVGIAKKSLLSVKGMAVIEEKNTLSENESSENSESYQ